MWIIILSLFMLAKGEVDCDAYRWDQCKRPELFRKIPLEVEVFNANCQDALTFMNCMKEYDMKCVDKEERMIEPERHENIISVFDEMCEEGTNLNQVATNNLKCLNETFSNTNCREEAEAFVKPYEKEEPVVESNTTTVVIPDTLYCLSGILFLGCILEDISLNCGLRARHATVEFLQRTTFVDPFCPLEYRKSLLEDIDDYHLSEVQKTYAISELERMKLADEA